jgi:hypothetical protein
LNDLFLSKYKLFLFLVFYPYISFHLNNLDSQPWLIFFGLFFFNTIFLTKSNFKLFIIFLFVPFISQLVALIYSYKFDFISFIRGLSSYLIFGFVFIYQFNNPNIFKKSFNYLFILNISYVIIGLIQILFSPDIFNWLVTVRTSASRGVTGLTPEPTAFGISFLFLILVNLLMLSNGNKSKVFFLITINVLSIIFIAKSTTALFYLLFAFILWLFIYIKISLKYFLYVLITFIVFLLFLNNLNEILPDSRIFSVINQISSNGIFSLILHDTSIFDRVMATIFGFKASFNNYFIPGGYNLTTSLNPINLIIDNTFISNYHAGNKLMSLWGALIAESGIIFIFIFLFFSYSFFIRVRKQQPDFKKRYIYIYFMLLGLGFSSISLSFPFIAFVISTIFANLNQKKIINE